MPLRVAVLTVFLALTTIATSCTSEAGESEYVDIDQVQAHAQPKPVRAFRIDCGRNENKHRNADNVVMQPGIAAGAHHVHDYVGNVSTDAFSTDRSLEAAATTCESDDRSTYYWPVLRLADEHGDDAHAPGGGLDGNHGRILQPDSVIVEYRGNPTSNVVAMPRFLHAITGNPVAISQDGENSEHVQWTCSGERDRITKRYPRCATGQQTIRVFDFPSCWNGLSTDSELHRAHLQFPTDNGSCDKGLFPVPQLHIEVAYSIPTGARFAIDSFPEERRSPLTDHAMFIGVLPESLNQQVTNTLNM